MWERFQKDMLLWSPGNLILRIPMPHLRPWRFGSRRLPSLETWDDSRMPGQRCSQPSQPSQPWPEYPPVNHQIQQLPKPAAILRVDMGGCNCSKIHVCHIYICVIHICITIGLLWYGSIVYICLYNVDVLLITPPNIKSIYIKFRTNNGLGSLENFPDLCGAEHIA